MSETLADYRRKAGFDTQEKLSKILNINRSTVVKWENGKRTPRLKMIPRLAEALNTTTDEVIAAITASRLSNTG